MFTKRFLFGTLAGAAVTATGFFLYQRNKDKIDVFLRSQGINMPAGTGGDYSEMSLEELVATKERIEDLIAEMEYARKEAETKA